MKKILICLAVISCCGCLPENEVEITEMPRTNVGRMKYIEYDGHEYLVWRSGSAGGICHSPKCPCQNNK